MFTKTLKQHIWSNGRIILCLSEGVNGFYFLTISDENNKYVDTFTTFDKRLAEKTYNQWKRKLFKNGLQNWHDTFLIKR